MSPLSRSLLASAVACGLAVPACAGAATITVTTTADAVAVDGACSLREAVSAANTNTAVAGAGECVAGEAVATDRIVVPAGTYRRSIGGGRENANATGDLDVTSPLEIAGAGNTATVIDAAGLDRVVDVLSAGRPVRISDLTLTGGVAPSGTPGTPTPSGADRHGGDGESGGGIRLVGVVTLERVRVVGNTGGAGGDGADVAQPTASGGAPGQVGGGGVGGGAGTGGIAAAGELTLSFSEVSGNTGGAGGAGGDGRGGGASGGITPAEGGAGLGGGGGHGGSGGIDAGGQVTIRDSVITGNRAGAGGPGGTGTGGDAGGGGAGADGGDGTGGAGGEGGDGGGVRVVGNVVIERTTIASNVTGSGGTGGSGRGGLRSGDAESGAGVGGSGGIGGSGGGIAKFNPTALSVRNLTITGNATAGGGGGGGGGFGITLGPDSAGGQGGGGGAGGGIFTDGTGATTASFLTITANGAGGPGGTGNFGTLGGAGAAGPIGTPGAGAGSAVTSDAPLSLAASIISGNSCGGVSLISDGGANLVQAATGCPGAPGDARLGALAGNGGTPPTQALPAGSPALDRFPAGAGCPATDARGALRPGGTGCDAGAFELSPPLATTGEASPSDTGAVLQATVQTRGLPGSVTFEFGTTEAYGSTTPVTAIAGAATPSVVSATVRGLVPAARYHYRVVVTGPDGRAVGADRTFTTRPAGVDAVPGGTGVTSGGAGPRLTALTVRPRRFIPIPRGGTPTTARRGRPAQGTVVSFRLSERATVRLGVTRVLPGRTRTVGGRTTCRAVSPGSAVPRARRCVVTRAVSTIVSPRAEGANRLVVTGRVRGRALAPGGYRLTLVAVAPTGLRSATARADITVLPVG